MPKENYADKIKELEEKVIALQNQLGTYKDLARSKVRTSCNDDADNIPRKTAAVEAHAHILTGRNIGVAGIAGLVITVGVALFSKNAASITGILFIGVLGFLTLRRVKAAQYLEEKYKINAQPIVPEGFRI